MKFWFKSFEVNFHNSLPPPPIPYTLKPLDTSFCCCFQAPDVDRHQHLSAKQRRYSDKTYQSLYDCLFSNLCCPPGNFVGRGKANRLTLPHPLNSSPLERSPSPSLCKFSSSSSNCQREGKRSHCGHTPSILYYYCIVLYVTVQTEEAEAKIWRPG